MTPEQYDLVATLATVVLGGGVLGGLATLIKSLSERRQIKAAAAERNIKSPAELGGLLASGSETLVGMALELAKAAKLESEAATAKAEAAEANAGQLRERMSQVEQQQRMDRESHDLELSRMQAALARASRHVARLLAYIEEHIPGATPPGADDEE